MTDELLDRFRAAAEAHEDIKVKGKKTPYTAVNGNMFAFISSEQELCLRFDETDRAALAADWGVAEVRQHGAVMRGYVALPAAVSGDADGLAAIFAKSLSFARALPAKPTKRR